jgi:hypothetical protein
MSPGDNLKQSSWFFSEAFLEPLDPHILLIHQEERGTGYKIILRFQNGFGVEIRPPFSAGGKVPVFKVKVLVLHFLGSRMKDCKRLPYPAMRKMNWANNDGKLIQFCQQVASLPVSLFSSSPRLKVSTWTPIRSTPPWKSSFW